VDNELHSVANSEDRDGILLAIVEKAIRKARSSFNMDGIGTSRKDNYLGVCFFDALL
jgi:hypothetical protein